MARSWKADQPKVLACFRDLTALFPVESTIYATALDIRADQSGQLAGKAGSKEQVLALLDKMSASHHFARPTLLDMRQAGRTTSEVTFSIGFVYTEGK